VIVSARYEEKAPASADRNAAGPSREIAEWTTAQKILVEAHGGVPWIWRLALGVAIVCAVIQIIKRAMVPAPEELDVSLLINSEAVVFWPTGENSMSAKLDHETPWGDEVQMYAQYLRFRHENLDATWARILALLRVTLSRMFVPRRKVWISMHPWSPDDNRKVETALLCLWRGLFGRKGSLWCNKKALALPDRGRSVETVFELDYRVDGESAPVPVPLEIRRENRPGEVNRE
jgi:hypothetical protein